MPPLLYQLSLESSVLSIVVCRVISCPESGPWGVNNQRKVFNVLRNSYDLQKGDSKMTQVIYTKYIWSGLLLVAIYLRQERETAITAPPAQSGWRVLMRLSAP